MRVSALQVCPEFMYAAPTPAGTIDAKSASSSSTLGDLPPSSSATFLMVGAASSDTRRPARVEPVKEIMSTSGCAASASPTTGPIPVTRLNTPGGNPRSSMISREDERVDRCDLRRLEHDGAAGGERVRDLGADLVQRVVPRRDAADHADRLPHDEALGVVLELGTSTPARRRCGTPRCRCPPGWRPRAAWACRPRGS